MALTLDSLKNSFPTGGLFGGGSWLLSPEPFKISKKLAKSLQNYGHPLACFQQACDSIYRRSSAHKAPPWIAEWLDRGKPDWLIALQSHPSTASQLPRVIRPDLMLTADGFSLTELDSVPGGIGVTAWLSQSYSNAGFEVLGGASGMIDGFRSILPHGGEVLISQESSDYQPEMAWLCQQLGPEWTIHPAESWTPTHRPAYRFFELFDWKQIPRARQLGELAATGSLEVTPPFKPHLEDKLWLALLCNPSLASLWDTSLRSNHLKSIRDLVPYGWIVDPTPIPPNAALPRLNVHSWQDVMKFSQKERKLVLKISGFHESAWGARGVFIGHDMPADQWQSAIQLALDQSTDHPWIMQDFIDSTIIEHPYFLENGEIAIMRGRVRLCPYYFTNHEGKTHFAGCLATIVPADKKKIHGMSDAILVPCMIDPSLA